MISMTSNAGRAAPPSGKAFASPPPRPFQPFGRCLTCPAAPPASNGNQPRPTIDSIQRLVAEHYRIARIEMTSARRSREVVWPRQVAMYLAKQLTPRSLPEIGRRFGGRDHSTVAYAVQQVEQRMVTDGKLRRAVADLTRELSPPAEADADQPDLFAETAP